MIKKLLSICRRTLFQRQRHFESDGQLITRPVESLMNQRIVARADCLYKMADLSSVAPAQRDKVLQHKRLQWSPFKKTGYYVYWQGPIAMIWLWDSNAINAPEDLDSVEFIPETVLNTQQHNGLVLQSCLRGFEEQCWQAGILKASRWWPVLPSQHDQQQLAVVAGLDCTNAQIAAPPGAPVPLQMKDHPWGKHYWSQLLLPRMLEQLIPGVCLVCLIAALGYYSAAGTVSWFSLTRAEAAFEERQALVGDVIDDRKAAYQLQSENETLLSLINQPSQLQLFERIVTLLPAAIENLSQWQYQGQTLKLTIKIDPKQELSPKQLVAGLESSPRFKNVLVNMNSRRRGYWQLTLEVQP